MQNPNVPTGAPDLTNLFTDIIKKIFGGGKPLPQPDKKPEEK